MVKSRLRVTVAAGFSSLLLTLWPAVLLAQDATPPTVSLTAPNNGATVMGTIGVVANASDNVGVAGVQFILDGAPLGATLNVPPYAVPWDTPPTVSLTAPAGGATVSGTVNVTAGASDNKGVAGVQFVLDGAPLGAPDTVAPYSVSWDTTLVPEGAHALSAVAFDTSGNNATAATVNVTVSNDTTPPVVKISAPADGVLVLGSVQVAAEASDNVAVAKVEFYVDGTLIADTVAPYTFNLDATSLPDGPRQLMAKAYDIAGNASAHFIAILVVHQDTWPPPPGPTITTPVSVALGAIPAAAEIVYISSGLIYVMDRTGQNVAQITFQNPRDWEHVAVSHDHRYIVGNARLTDSSGGLHSQLWILDLQTGTEARLVPGFASAGSGGVDWDPAGAIYFAGAVTAGALLDAFKIKPDGTGLTRLTDTPLLAEADVSVSDDGTFVPHIKSAPLLVEGQIKHQTEVWLMNSDGANPRLVKKAARLGTPGKEGVADPELSADNTKIVFSEHNVDVPPNFPNDPAGGVAHDIWKINIDGTGLTRLTQPGPISMIPDWKEDLVVYTELNDRGAYAGAAMVSANGFEQAPVRFKYGAGIPKWIPVSSASPPALAPAMDPQYLIFQLFTYGGVPPTQPFDKAAKAAEIDEILAAVKGLRGDGQSRQLGFAVGPLSLDHTDAELRTTISQSFSLALEKNVAVSIHIDDSMFWMNRKDLWSDPKNVEWSDWNATIHPHRWVGWAPTVLAPQMCYTSPSLRQEVGRIARNVIGDEIRKGMLNLKALGKEHLFAGVIPGWETHIADYRFLDSNDPQLVQVYGQGGFPTTRIGYCALSNLGYSAQNPPADFDVELAKVVQDWALFWAKEINQGGVPKERIYTHISYPVLTDEMAKRAMDQFAQKYGVRLSTLAMVHAAGWSAFNSYSRPGFSHYSAGFRVDGLDAVLADIQRELGKNGNPRWAMSEGTNTSPQAGDSGASWEEFLGSKFNRGAGLVNVFAWSDPSGYGTSTRSTEAVAAYTKFLSGGTLDDQLPTVAINSPAQGATVSGTVQIAVSATDNVGVSTVAFYVDGVFKASDTASPYAYSWDASAVSVGAHTLVVKAYDAAGNVSFDFVSVQVLNAAIYYVPPPQTTITPPSSLPDGKIIFQSDRDGNWEIYTVNPDGSGLARLTNNTAVDADPRFSPDGTTILFASNRDSPGNQDIYIMDADGKNAKRLTTYPQVDSQPDFSPDGKKIVFTRGNATTPDKLELDIYTMNADGSNVVRLTSHTAADFEATWSPDGSRILFQSERDGPVNLYLMNTDGGGVTRLLANSPLFQGEGDAEWSPDGSKIVFTVSNSSGDWVYVMNADGSQPHAVTRPKPEADGGIDLQGDPGWSPDGRRIAFVSTRGGLATKDDIYVINADGTGEFLVSSSTGFDRNPLWSRGTQLPSSNTTITTPIPVRLGQIPASAEIVYSSDGFIYVMDKDGGGGAQITFGEPRPYEHVAVSHDRRYVVGKVNLETDEAKGTILRSGIMLYDLDNGTEARLVPGFLDAGAGGVDWGPDGYIYFTGWDESSAPGIYKMKPDGSSFVKLSGLTSTDLSVSEDGRMIAFIYFDTGTYSAATNTSVNEVWVMNSDGTNGRRVKRANVPGVPGKGGVADPELSPDNLKVVFSEENKDVAPNFPESPAGGVAHDLWIANLDGTGLTRITKPGPISIIPDWRSDGLVVYSELSDADDYLGASIVSSADSEQAPLRIMRGANSPKWIARSAAVVRVSSGTILPGSGGRVGSVAANSVEVVAKSDAVLTAIRMEIRPEDRTDSIREAGKRHDEGSRGLLRVGAAAEITAAVLASSAAFTRFQKPVTLTLAYDPAKVKNLDALGIFYWDETFVRWQALPGAKIDVLNRTVTTETGHLSTFAVLEVPSSHSAGLEFAGVFAYPNPARGRRATLHIESGTVDHVEIRIYDLAGGLVHRATLSGSPGVGINGKPAYEYAWDISGVASGAYLYAVEARRGGEIIRSLRKLAVVR